MGAKVDSALAPEVTTVVFFGVDPKDGQFLEKETSAYYECMLAGKWLVGKDCESQFTVQLTQFL